MFNFEISWPTVLLSIVCVFLGTPGTSLAQDARAMYRQVVRAEKDLLDYWAFDGSLGDSKGALNKGKPTFVTGPEGGKALAVSDRQFVTVEKTPELDTPEITVECFFKLTAQPTCNSCLVAKRGAEKTRFSIHVHPELGEFLIWNGRAVIPANVPVEPMRVGEWYHLVVSFTSGNLGVYLDGVRCDVRGGGGLNPDAKDQPLRIGAARPDGYEPCAFAIRDLAFYGRVLSAEDVARHIAAIGWTKKSEKILAEKKAQDEKRKQERMEKLVQRKNDPRLFATGETNVFHDETLGAVDFPLGGIGAGCIQINGKAERNIWQIFNNFQGVFVPDSFFAVMVQKDDAASVAAHKVFDTRVVRALQTSPVGPFAAMKGLSLRAEYPFALYEFEDDDLPVKVRLEAFTPLIPMALKDSSMPCALFRLSATNSGYQPVRVSFLGTQLNAVGYACNAAIEERQPAHTVFEARGGEGLGGNVNRIVRESDMTALHMTSERPKQDPYYGDMVLAVLKDKAGGCVSWRGLGELHTAFAGSGFEEAKEAGPSAKGETLAGALAVPFDLEPGASHTVAFVLTWYFPNGQHGAGEWGGKGNMYANWWDSALDVARAVQARYGPLKTQTRTYHDTLYASNLPPWLLDRLSSQVAILRSKTCFWTKDGFFGGWEGCCPSAGCCHGNCGHVWHYAQAHARLFPEVARRMREQVLACQQGDGGLPFRLPKSIVACDSQCGEVLEAYREHLDTTSGEWLHAHWPRIRKAMDFAIKQWDRDEDGILSGAQHNTLDVELGGSSSWLGSMYLAALRAAEKMALLEGASDAAERYRRIGESGATKQNETLWNGEYYFQIPDPEPQRDYNDGCHIDQVLGQWWANQLDLGWVYPRDRVRTAMGSLIQYNFRSDFHGVTQAPRKFVADDDAGMQMIVWPNGVRPANHMLYADEVMTGFEYAAAATMVQAGMIEEGFMVLRAVADRYDGRLREGLTAADTSSWGYSGNPFGDDECGKFYARAMSVWSVLLACQGFFYDGPMGRIAFRPVWQPEDHASFFTGAEGWGLFTQKRVDGVQQAMIELAYGQLELREVTLALPEGAKVKEVAARVDRGPLEVQFACGAGDVTMAFETPVVLKGGERLKMDVEYR